MMFGWVILILLIAYFFFSWNPRENHERSYSTRGRNALDILKERYARGEIERDEYLARKQELER